MEVIESKSRKFSRFINLTPHLEEKDAAILEVKQRYTAFFSVKS